jgi:hypothetical protein
VFDIFFCIFSAQVQSQQQHMMQQQQQQQQLQQQIYYQQYYYQQQQQQQYPSMPNMYYPQQQLHMNYAIPGQHAQPTASYTPYSYAQAVTAAPASVPSASVSMSTPAIVPVVPNKKPNPIRFAPSVPASAPPAAVLTKAASASDASSWPPSLKAFVVRSFSTCQTDDDRTHMQDTLKKIMNRVASEGRLSIHKWDLEPTPQLLRAAVPEAVKVPPAGNCVVVRLLVISFRVRKLIKYLVISHLFKFPHHPRRILVSCQGLREHQSARASSQLLLNLIRSRERFKLLAFNKSIALIITVYPILFGLSQDTDSNSIQFTVLEEQQVVYRVILKKRARLRGKRRGAIKLWSMRWLSVTLSDTYILQIIAHILPFFPAKRLETYSKARRQVKFIYFL